MKTYELDELVKCSRDEKYFIETYFKVINPYKGLSLITLEKQQENILNRITNKDFVIDDIAERQIGTSTILAAHAVWLALFHPYQRIVIMNVKNTNAKEMRYIVKTGYDNLPEHMKLKKIADNAHTLGLDNSSWIRYVNSNPVHLHGFSTSLIILDTFDFFKETYRTELQNLCEDHNLNAEQLLSVT